MNFDLDHVARLAAKLVIIEEQAKETLDTLEEITGLPLRETARRTSRKPLTPP